MNIRNQLLLLTASIIVFGLHRIHSDFGGFSAAQTSEQTRQAQRSSMVPVTNNTTPGQAAPAAMQTNTNCNCPSPDATASAIAPCVISLVSASNTVLNSVDGQPGHLFNIPNTFTSSSAMLTVHIYPKANSINGSTINFANASSTGTYIIAYTLQDTAGSMVYKEFDNGITLANLPHQITISTATTMTAPAEGQTATWTTQGNNIIAQSTFIPPATQLSSAQRQQIFNGISPVIQKFLITQSNGQTSATPISGTFDPSSSSNSTNMVPASIPATIGQNISPISISFDGGTTPCVTFANNTNITINSADLAQGLVLHITIFPSNAGNNYPVVAVLKTMDGLKLLKQSTLGTGQTSATNLTTIPTNITLSYGNTVILTTSFLNTNITNQALTIISPIHLKFIINQTQGNQVAASMI